MGAATVTLGLAGLGLSATSAQAATNDAVDPAAGQFVEGPGAPDAAHPGAKFDEGLYKTFAGMDNQSFNTVRNALMSQNPDDESNPELRQREQELQRSFYSNGCTGVPSSFVSQRTTNACAQHDFRYTVGPNVYGEQTEAGKAERAAADAQLGENIGGWTGAGAKLLTNQVGGWFFKSTPTAG